MSNESLVLNESQLGKKVPYDSTYNPALLFPIARENKRRELGLSRECPFVGFDVWNHYEVSWLNAKGKPMVAIAEITYPCESPNIIESKSMKLYFNSFNQTVFQHKSDLVAVIERDISAGVGLPVLVHLAELRELNDGYYHAGMAGICLDELDIECDIYQVHSDFLRIGAGHVKETLYSNLLKSNCLVTHQPDWATVQIYYQGPKIDHAGLLKYLVSYRNHNEFHEQCIERIFVDIRRCCQPQELAVYGRFTRRGGLDINAYRGTKLFQPLINNQRLIRQ